MWHSAFDSSGSGSGHISGSSDDPSDHGFYGGEADEFAFLRDEEALPVSTQNNKSEREERG